MLRLTAVALLIAVVIGCGSFRVHKPVSLPPGSLVPWMNRPAPAYKEQPPPSPSPYPTNAAACTAASLLVTAGRQGAAAGNELQQFIFTNSGSFPCLLAGNPVVTATDPQGKRVTLTSGSGTFFGPVWPANIRAGGAGELDFGTAGGCGTQQSVPYSSLSFQMPGGGRIDSSLSLFVGSCGLSSSGLGLPPPQITVPSPAPGSVQTLTAGLELPQSVARGHELAYVVVLTNSSTADVELSSCPSYTENLGSLTRSYWLNCDSVGQIAAGASYRFEMKLAVPLSAPTGAYKFSWRINDPSGPFCGSSISLIT